MCAHELGKLSPLMLYSVSNYRSLIITSYYPAAEAQYVKVSVCFT